MLRHEAQMQRCAYVSVCVYTHAHTRHACFRSSMPTIVRAFVRVSVHVCVYEFVYLCVCMRVPVAMKDH